MAKTKITAPVAAEGDVVGVGGLVFTDGVAETDDPAIIEYAERHGYGIGGKKPTLPEPEEHSREVHANGPEMVGTPLRDAAVDPRPEDYLAPINAGKADPHGPLVVAPEVHGSTHGPLIPGHTTEDREKEAARLARIEGKPADEVTQALAGDDTGPLDLSDPSSGQFADTGVAPLEDTDGDDDARNEGQREQGRRAAKKSTPRKQTGL